MLQYIHTNIHTLNRHTKPKCKREEFNVKWGNVCSVENLTQIQGAGEK